MPRKLKVATTAWNLRPSTGAQDNIDYACELLNTAGSAGADVCALPETLNVIGIPRDQRKANVEPSIPGPATERFAEAARRHKMHVVAGLYNYREGRIMNTAVMLDRQGNVVWQYEKIHPTIGEVEMGVVPGEICPSICDAEFGRTGFAVCYDIGWPGHWDQLAEDGAEVVFWPSAYDGGFPLQTYAWRNMCYVVSSVWSAHAKIIDITGQIISQTSKFSHLLIDEIDLEKEVFHTDDNAARLMALQERHGHEITLRTLDEEHVFTLQSNNPSLSVAKLKQDFRLEAFTDYHARASRVQDKARAVPAEALPA